MGYRTEGSFLSYSKVKKLIKILNFVIYFLKDNNQRGKIQKTIQSNICIFKYLIFNALFLTFCRHRLKWHKRVSKKSINFFLVLSFINRRQCCAVSPLVKIICEIFLFFALLLLSINF